MQLRSWRAFFRGCQDLPRRYPTQPWHIQPGFGEIEGPPGVEEAFKEIPFVAPNKFGTPRVPYVARRPTHLSNKIVLKAPLCMLHQSEFGSPSSVRPESLAHSNSGISPRALHTPSPLGLFLGPWVGGGGGLNAWARGLQNEPHKQNGAPLFSREPVIGLIGHGLGPMRSHGMTTKAWPSLREPNQRDTLRNTTACVFTHNVLTVSKKVLHEKAPVLQKDQNRQTK